MRGTVFDIITVTMREIVFDIVVVVAWLQATSSTKNNFAIVNCGEVWFVVLSRG